MDNKKIKEEIWKAQKIGKSSLGLDYREYSKRYGGLVIDAATLPDGVMFEVKNGCWIGYIETDKDGNRVIYAGVSMNDSDMKKHASNVITIREGESYDIIVGDIYVKDVITANISKINMLKFNPMTTDVFKLREALDDIKTQHETDEDKKRQLLDWAKSIAKTQETIKTADVKSFIEQLYSDKVYSDFDEIRDCISKAYNEDAVELNALHFNFNVKAKKSMLLDIYRGLVKQINGDELVCLNNTNMIVNGNEEIVEGTLAQIKEDDYADVYEGNYKDFLTSFNDAEKNTGIYRLMDAEYLDDEHVKGVKLEFIA